MSNNDSVDIKLIYEKESHKPIDRKQEGMTPKNSIIQMEHHHCHQHAPNCNHDHDHSQEHKHSHQNKKSFHANQSVSISFEQIVNASLKLSSSNDEFKYMLVYLFIWLAIVLFEFVYGFLETQGQIISDSFFNFFKTFSFLITGVSLLLTRVYVFDSVFLKSRIELLAALSNCMFLVIVSMYMFVEGLHLITDNDSGAHSHHDHNDKNNYHFLRDFYVIKIILDVSALLIFSDYIVHPSVQIKLFLWKKIRRWIDLSQVEIEHLKESKNLIKGWNNHFENMNALVINIISDLMTSILFLIFFYYAQDSHYNIYYPLVSLLNLFLILILARPIFSSVLKVLMQGRPEIYESFYNRLEKDLSIFEGCIGVKEIKFWTSSQNEVRSLIKIYCNSDFSRSKLNEHIHNLADHLGIDFDYTLEITN